MVSGPNVRTSLEKLLEDSRTRITLLERRLAILGDGGGGSGGGGRNVTPAGTVSAWAGPPSTIPAGWLLCDGSAISRVAYPGLFAAIGTTYGAGDGSTTFNLPNGKGKFVVGQDGTQVEFDTVGEIGGAKAHRHDFRFGLFDNRWTPTGSYAGMEAASQPNGNDKMGAFRYSTGTFQGATAGNPALSPSSLALNSATAAGTPVNAQLGRMESVGDTDVPTGTTGLPPYLVHNWIISTGAGSSTTPGAVVPVQLWQEFTLAKPGGLRPLVGGAVVWDGPISGTLGATLAADKATITLPAAGTYRILTHLGLAANNGTGTSSALYVSGTLLPKSQGYGNAGVAGVYVNTVETYITVTGPTTFTQGATAALGMYDWTWMRIEKLEPFFPNSALTVNQGSTGQRDAVYGVPANSAAQASLANRGIVWFNTDKGWYETYYAVTGTTGLTARGLMAGATAGWYPNAGSQIFVTLKRTTDQSIGAGATADIVYDSKVSFQGFTGGAPLSTVNVPYGGFYEMSVSAVAAQAAANFINLALLVNGAGVRGESGAVFPHTNAYSISTILPFIHPIPAAGTPIKTTAYLSSAGNVVANSPVLTVKYLGPPLVNS